MLIVNRGKISHSLVCCSISKFFLLLYFLGESKQTKTFRTHPVKAKTMLATSRRPGYGKQSLDFSTSFGTLDLNLSTATFDYNKSVTTFAADDGGTQPAQFSLPAKMQGATGGLLSTHLEGGGGDEEDEKEEEVEEEIMVGTSQEVEEKRSTESSEETTTKTRNGERRRRSHRRSSSSNGGASSRRRSSSGGRPRSSSRPRTRSRSRNGRRRTTRRHQKTLDLLQDLSPSKQLESEEKAANNYDEKSPVKESDGQENEVKSGLIVERVPSTPTREPSRDNDDAEKLSTTPLMTPSMVDKVADNGGLCLSSPSPQLTPTTIASEATITPISCRVEKSKWKKFYNGKSFKRKSKKSVQFPLCLVTNYHTDKLNGSEREFELTWYNMKELTQIKSARNIDVKMALSGEPEKAPYCYRGVDVSLQQLERREQNVERARKAVLAEQGQPKSSVKSIAKAYTSLSASCQVYAHTVGKLDEKAIMDMDPNSYALRNHKDGGLSSHSDHGKPPRARRGGGKDPLSQSDHGAPRFRSLSRKSHKDDGLSNSEHGARPPLRRRAKHRDSLSSNGSDHSSHSFCATADDSSTGVDSPMTKPSGVVKKATNIKRRITQLGRGAKKDSAFTSLLHDENDSD